MENQQQQVNLLIPQTSVSVSTYFLKNVKPIAHYDLVSKLPNSDNGTDLFSKILTYLGIFLAVSDWFSDIKLSITHFSNQNNVAGILTILIVGFSGCISWAVYKFSRLGLLDPVGNLRRLNAVKCMLNIPTLQTIGSALEAVIYESDPADFEERHNYDPKPKPYFRYEIKKLDQIHRQRNIIYSTIEVITEALPQAYLQLYIIFAQLISSNEFSVNWDQIFSIITSITSLTSCKLKLYVTKHILSSGSFNLTSQTEPDLLILPPLLIKLWIYFAVFGKYFCKYCCYAFSYIILPIGISHLIHPAGSFFILFLLLACPRFLFSYYSKQDDKLFNRILNLIIKTHSTKYEFQLYYYFDFFEPIIYYLGWLTITLIIHRNDISSQYSLTIWITSIIIIPFILQCFFSFCMLNYGIKLVKHWQKPYKILTWFDKILLQIQENGTYDRNELLIQPVKHNYDKTEVRRKIIKFYNLNRKKFSMDAYIQNELTNNFSGGALIIEFTMIKLSNLLLFDKVGSDVANLLAEDIYSYICLKYSSKGDKILSKLGKYFIFCSDTRLQYLAKEFLVRHHNEIEMDEYIDPSI